MAKLDLKENEKLLGEEQASHVKKFLFGFFHRAKPVSAENRRFFELALRG